MHYLPKESYCSGSTPDTGLVKNFLQSSFISFSVAVSRALGISARLGKGPAGIPYTFTSRLETKLKDIDYLGMVKNMNVCFMFITEVSMKESQ